MTETLDMNAWLRERLTPTDQDHAMALRLFGLTEQDQQDQQDDVDPEGDDAA